MSVAIMRRRIRTGLRDIVAGSSRGYDRLRTAVKPMDRFAPNCLWIIALGYLLVYPVTSTALTVIIDTGQTESILPFLEPFEAQDEALQPPKTQTRTVGAAAPETWLPIRSPGLTPGRVKTRSHERPFTRPLFLIGSDPRSWRWLKRNQARLKAIGAVGMLVQAETVGDLELIIELAIGLSILPASATDIAKALGISHYPVLISAHAIEQ